MDPYADDDAHVAAVAAIAASVRARPSGAPLSIVKATRSHLPHPKPHKARAHGVDVTALTRVLSVDAERGLIVAQGLVSMGALVDAALARGWVPQVVPELRAFTVSGLINGLGVQSSSHRFGTFPDSCESFQVVLADGRVVTASAASEPTLFRQLPGSYGTLGIVTAAVVRCVRAMPLVRSRYFGVRSAAEMQYALACAAGRCDYVDGYMYSRTQGVVVVGDFARAARAGEPQWDVAPEAEQYYYQHARDMGARSLRERSGGAIAELPLGWSAASPTAGTGAAGAGAPARRMPSACSAAGVLAAASVDPAWLFERRPATADVMPTADYIFRLERGFWWQVAYMVGLPALTESRWGRAAVAAAVNSELASLDSSAAGAATAGAAPATAAPAATASWSGQSGANARWRPADMHRCAVNQDCVLRLGRVAEGIDYVARELEVWPLWLCPCLVHDTASAMAGAGLRRAVADEQAAAAGGGGIAAPPPPQPLPLMSCDMGVYGEPGVRGFMHRRDVRALQRFVDAPAFWGMSYLAPHELAGVYDLGAYDAARAAYGADAGAFPHITSKVSFYDGDAEDAPPIALWRLYRRGVREPVLAALALAAAGLAYGGAKACGWRGLGLREHAAGLLRALWALGGASGGGGGGAGWAA